MPKKKLSIEEEEKIKPKKIVRGVQTESGHFACPRCGNYDGQIIDYGVIDHMFRFVRYCSNCDIGYYYIKERI